MKTLLRLAQFLFILPLIIMAYAIPAHSADCPPNIDPSYCAVAGATGGKVYSGTPDETFKNIEKDYQQSDVTVSTTKHDIINFFKGALYLLPALLPFITLATIRRKIENRKLFASLYALGNLIPAFSLFIYFLNTGAGYGLTEAALIFGGLSAVISFLVGYYKKDQTSPLYIVTFLSTFLVYLPILALLSLTM